MHSRAEAAPSLLYLPDLASAPHEFMLEGPEAHYLARVVRARTGESVRATDGAGRVAVLEVIESRPGLRLRRVSLETCTRTRGLTLAIGAPEGDRAEWLVEKAAEFAASAIVPLDCERGVWRGFRPDRLERLAIAGMRQSLSPFRVRIAGPITISAWLAGLPKEGGRFEGSPLGGPVSELAAPALGDAFVVIGPSSGFAAGERKMLSENGFTPIAFAVGRLRTETAGLAALAWWAAGDPGLVNPASSLVAPHGTQPPSLQPPSS